MTSLDEIKNDNRRFELQLKKPHGNDGKIIAKFLSEHNKPQTEWSVSELDLNSNDQVLEIGFGSGDGIRLISSKIISGKVYGIDFSDVMFDVAKELNKSGIKMGNVILIHDDIDNYDFGNLTFNKIMGVNVLYFWDNPTITINKLYRLLKPGGKIVLFIYHKKDQKDREREGIFYNYSGEEVVELLKNAGFNYARFEEKSFDSNNRLGVLGIGEKK